MRGRRRAASVACWGSVLLAAFQRALQELGLLEDEAPVLVALSGGLDSVVLLDIAVECLGRSRVIAGHVDHAARAGSAEDASRVAEIADAVGVELESVRLPEGPADEARLRELRYAALEAMRQGRGASAILVAHTEDDQAETVLLDLIRGGGGTQLRGMPEVRGRIVRPLLHVPRKLVHQHARSRQLAFVEDPSNLEPRYLRNRIRKELLPLLESRYRAKIAHRLARRATAAPTEARPLSASRNRGAEPGVVDLDGPSIEISWSETGARRPADLWSCVLDARAVPRPVIRLPRPGDRIEVLGLLGHKKLQDIFVDAKVPRAQRRRYAVLVAEGQIVWVPGLARAPIGLIGPETGPVWVVTARI